jgi:diguanylate cyclase (GGDEF)-like protein/PAS domain S-box-containing protein
MPADRPFMHSHPGDHGVFRGNSLIDKVPLLFAWRHLAIWPVFSFTGINEEAELGGIFSQQSDTRKRTLLAMALVVAFAIWIAVLVMRNNIKNHELAKNEARLRIMLENELVGIVTVRDRTIQWANPAYEKLLGYAEGELNGAPARLIFLNDDTYQALGKIAYPVINTGKVFRTELEYLCKDGSHRTVDVSGGILNPQTGESLWTCIDITGRKLAQESLLKQKQFSDDIINSLPGIFYMLNPQGRIIRANPQFFSVSGYSNDELDNLSALSFFEGKDKDLVAQKIQESFETGNSSVEAEFVTRFGHKIPYYFSGHRTTINDQPYIVGLGTDITERKRAEQALKRESEKNLALLRNASDGIHILDYDGNIIEASDSFCTMLGYRRYEILGMNVSRWDAGFANSEELLAVVRQQLKSSVVSLFETRHRRKDGTIIDVEVSGFPLELDGKQVLFNSSRDITERKRTKEALRASEERYRLLYDMSLDGILLTAPDGRIMAANRSACAMFQHTEEELRQAGRNGVVDATDPRLALAIEERNQTGKFVGELTFFRKDGTKFPAEISSAIFKDMGGHTRSSMTIRDVTERKKAETELRIAATAFESHEGMMITDANGTILRVNRAFTNITGYSAEEAIGKNPRMLKSGRHDAAFYATLLESITTTGSWEGEIWNRRKNGHVYPEHLTVTAVKGSEDIVSNYVATLTDITLNKAAEDEIRHLAFYDPLTRLPNRRLLVDRFRQALASSARSGRTGAILFIDLDNFKTLNDTLGHDIGDLLLQQVAHRLESCVREGDTVARLGGDEFVVMLEDLSARKNEATTHTEAVGNKILATLNQPYQLASHVYLNSPSIGATLFNGNLQTIDELMKQADIAMYQAKNAGRNTLRFFDQQIDNPFNLPGLAA